MATVDFVSEKYSIEDILTRRSYIVPRFQRPFSWELENFDDLWRDAIESDDFGYFIGPMVAWKKSEDGRTLAIVDGQQRLTTITVILSIIRDEFASLGDENLVQGTQNFLERTNRDNERYFVLQPQDPTPFYNRGILRNPPDQTVQPQSTSEDNLREARDWLRTRVVEYIGEVTDRDARIARLKRLRDQVLSLTVIWVEHSDEDDAYIVFETLNSRGKDLATSDLLKNLLLSKLRADNPAADAPRDSWKEVLAHLQIEDGIINADKFILYWWLSTETYVGQKTLFRRIRERVDSAEVARKKLGSLVTDSALYRTIQDPASRAWAPEELEIFRALEALLLMQVTQPTPLLLAMLRDRRDATVNMKPLRKTFRAIECYHFQFNTIAKQSSTGGISRMYARYAQDLTRTSGKAEKAAVLGQVSSALSEKVPEEALFLGGFPSLSYTSRTPRDKRLVQYVLRNLHETVRTHRPSKPTLEHLLPEDHIDDVTPIAVVGSIGNLLRLEESLNGQLGNKTFNQKKQILAPHAGEYDITDVLDCSQWGQQEIAARTARLAAQARHDTWKIAP